MTENKRFELENEDGTICIKDNIRKKYIFAFICEDIDMKEGMLEECENVVNCLNQTWEQTQRFEKSNQEYITENEELKKRLYDLQKENYGNIDGIAFYQEENASLCEKISDLECENEELKKENYKLHKRLGDFEPFEKYIKERTSKISVNDIIKTDEHTK